MCGCLSARCVGFVAAALNVDANANAIVDVNVDVDVYLSVDPNVDADADLGIWGSGLNVAALRQFHALRDDFLGPPMLECRELAPIRLPERGRL